MHTAMFGVGGCNCFGQPPALRKLEKGLGYM